MAFLDFLRPKWKHSNPAVRKAAVRRLTDARTLEHLAQNDADEEVRTAASARLSGLIAALARSASEPAARLAAIARLDDSQVLASIARSDSDTTVREAAVEKVHDEALLVDILIDETDWGVASAAIDKLGGRPSLAHIATNAKDASVRNQALSALKDDSARARIAKACKDADISRKAAYQIQDQALLADVARNAGTSGTRETAVWRLIDEDCLVDIARSDPEARIREAAAARLPRIALRRLRRVSDAAELLRQANESPSQEVRVAACRFLSDRKLLTVLADKARDLRVRGAAAQEAQAWTNSVGIRLLPVPQRDHALGAFSVTNAQFARWKPDHDSSRPLPGCEAADAGTPTEKTRMPEEIATRADCPVVCVSRTDAAQFCQWLTERERRRYRLPTFAEWRHAMGAGRTDWWVARDEEGLPVAQQYRMDLVCTNRAPAEGTRAFGDALPNPWGFYDILGNVFELVSDQPPSASVMRRIREQDVIDGRIAGPGVAPYMAQSCSPQEYAVYAGVGWSDLNDLVWPVKFRELGPWRHVFCFTGRHGFSQEEEVGFRVLCEQPS